MTHLCHSRNRIIEKTIDMTYITLPYDFSVSSWYQCQNIQNVFVLGCQNKVMLKAENKTRARYSL